MVSFNDVLFAAGTGSGAAEHRDGESAETSTAEDTSAASAGDDEHEVASDGTNGQADEEGTGVEAAITERDRSDVFIPRARPAAASDEPAADEATASTEPTPDQDDGTGPISDRP